MVEVAEVAPEKADWEDAWLRVFRDTGIVRLACHAAGISRTHAYRWRDRRPEFAAAWKEAEEDAVELLEAEARSRARKTSDVLMIFLLKSLRPAKYRETIRNEHTGADGGPIEVKSVANAFDYRLAALLERDGQGDDPVESLGRSEGGPVLPVGALGEAEPDRS